MRVLILHVPLRMGPYRPTPQPCRGPLRGLSRGATLGGGPPLGGPHPEGEPRGGNEGAPGSGWGVACKGIDERGGNNLVARAVRKAKSGAPEISKVMLAQLYFR